MKAIRVPVKDNKKPRVFIEYLKSYKNSRYGRSDWNDFILFCASLRSLPLFKIHVFMRFLTIFVFVLVFDNHLQKGDFQKIRGFFGDEIGRFQSDDFI